MTSKRLHNWCTPLKTPIHFSLPEILRVICSYVRVLLTTKSSNLPSFWALTSECKVQSTCAWSHIVGLKEPHLLKPFGKLSNLLITILYNLKTLKIGEVFNKLLLMKYFIYSGGCFPTQLPSAMAQQWYHTVCPGIVDWCKTAGLQ